MKTFKLPQQAETAVNNVKKTGELFKKYNLAIIEEKYVPNDSLKDEIFRLLNAPPITTYGKDAQLISFLYEFKVHIDDGQIVKAVEEIANRMDTTFFPKYKEDFKKDKDYVKLTRMLTIYDINDGSGVDVTEYLDDNFDWQKVIGDFIFKNFKLGVVQPPPPPGTAPNSPKSSNNNNNNNNTTVVTTTPTVVVAPKKPKIDTTTTTTTPAAPVVSVWNTEFLDKVERVVQGGLGYFDTFLNGLASFLGDKKSYFYYKYEAKVIDKNVSSMEEFVRKNSHLGRNFFTEVMPLLMTEELNKTPPRDREIQLIGDNDNIFPVAQVPGYIEDEEFILTLVNRDFVRGPSPAQGIDHDYIYGILDEATFTAVCEPAVMGAILTAKAQINRIPGKEDFTLKELMMSPGVFDMFQQRVSFVFLSGSGGYAYAGRSSNTQFGKVNGTTFNVSVGLKQREALAANMECSGYWFQDVYKVQNPRIKELENFVEKCGTELKRILANLNVSLDENRAIRRGARNLTDQNPQDPTQLYPPYAFNNLDIDEKLIFLDEFCTGVKISLFSKLASTAGKLTVRNVDIELKDGTQKLFVKTAFRLRLAQNQLLHVPKFVLVHYE